MAITATAKAKVFIGTVKTYASGTGAALSVTDYTTGETFVEVKQVSDLGEFGDNAEEIKFSTISDGRVYKAKGVRDAGDLSITVGRDAADAGQTALRNAAKDDLNRSIKVVLNDAATQGGTGTTFYFRALTQGSTNKFGGPNEVVQQTFTLAINSEILEVAPA